jgi:hypothetical protein
MRISTFTHGVLDYCTGILLVASPWLFHFNHVRAESSIAWAFGGALLLLSVLTDYELSLLRFVPFPIHRFADLLLGIFLVGAPIHFATSVLPSVIFVAAGLLEFGTALLTRSGKPAGHPIVPGASDDTLRT